jgi:hypothetical protein
MLKHSDLFSEGPSRSLQGFGSLSENGDEFILPLAGGTFDRLTLSQWAQQEIAA